MSAVSCPGDEKLREGLSRNFQVFDPLERDRPGRRSGRDARVPDNSEVDPEKECNAGENAAISRSSGV